MRSFEIFRPLIVTLLLMAFTASCTDSSSGGGTTGLTTTPTPTPTPPPTSSTVTISGTISYEYVPISSTGTGLNYNAISQRPARGVEVEVVDGSGTVLGTAFTLATGAYSFSVPSNTDVRIRAKARTVESTVATWNFEVVDNTNSNALYTLQGALTSSGSNNSTRNLVATTGWGGASYTGARNAAPFAILDAIYSTMQTIATAQPGILFPTGRVFWSINNRSADGDITIGEIGTTSYTRIAGTPTILVLGNENNDTDEFDSHVIVHEFGHYLQDQLSRDDSLGGSHSGSIRLDPRVAFSEGLATAFSGIFLNDAIYTDSFGNAQSLHFEINIESPSTTFPGWFSEATILGLVYDIADPANEASDNIAFGFIPIVETLSGVSFKNTPSSTTVFVFLNALRTHPSVNATALDAHLVPLNIDGVGEYGTGETHDGAIPSSLPVFKTVTVGGPAIQICSVDDAGTYNRLGNRALIHLSLGIAGTHTLTMTRTSGDANRNPDFNIYAFGNFIARSDSTVVDSETRIVSLSANEYIIDAYDLNNVELGGTPGDACYDFSVN